MSLNALHHVMSVYNQKRGLGRSRSLKQRVLSLFDRFRLDNFGSVNLKKISYNKVGDSWLKTRAIKAYITVESLLEYRLVRTACYAICGYILVDAGSAAIDNGDVLKTAVEGLQKEIFGSGWVTVGKIAAAAVGGVMAIARSSAVPFAMGAGVAGGLHFFQLNTKAAATCLLDAAPEVVNHLNSMI